MSVTYISARLRRQVVRQADHLCEYCLLHEQDMFFGGEIDHIISEKHGGLTQANNLALACFSCNRNKGSDVASIVPFSQRVVRFFHPRLDHWHQHFRLEEAAGMVITSLTEIGEATTRILGMNESDRLLERRSLQITDRYPSPAAKKRIDGSTVSQ